MDTVKIDNVTYNVIKARTADQMEAEGFPNVAKNMRSHNVKLDLVLQRPKGQRLYWTIQWTNNVYATLVKF